MRALVIDDERLARSDLKRLLQRHPEISVVGEAADADSAHELIVSLKPDLIFLDVQMPGKNGFELLQELESSPVVIFTTAYDEHAIKAFEVSALDYLLKPLRANRLAEAIEKALAGYRLAADQPREPRLTTESRIFVKDGPRCWFVKLADVRLFESEGNYARLYFGKQQPLVYRSLKQLEERLDPKAFFRADRRYLIGLRWVQDLAAMPDGSIRVRLKDGHEVEMSRRQARRFRQLMGL